MEIKTAVYIGLKKMLKLSNHEVNLNFANKLILSHPSYPSLESFSETLNILKILHEVCFADFELLRPDLEATMLHLKIDEGKFVVLIKKTNDKVTIYNPETEKLEELNKENLLTLWSGVTLIIPKKTMSLKRNKRRNPVFIFIGCILCFSFLFVFLKNESHLFLMTFTIQILGLFTTLLIALHELQYDNRLTSEICKKGNSFSCNDVLSSPGAKLLGLISLGDIGIIYFSGGLLVLLFIPFLNNPTEYLSLMYLFSICTLPYTLYSVYYQKFKVEKWCPLCLLVLFFLWLSFINYSLFIDNLHVKSISSVLFPLEIFGSTTIFWFILKDLLSTKKEKMILEINALKLKRNPEIFQSLFKRQKFLTMDYSSDDFIFGNSNSSLIITTIISEKCKYCKILVKSLIDLLDTNLDFMWVLRFDGINDEGWLENNFYFQRVFIKKYNKNGKLALEVLRKWADGEKTQNESESESKTNLPPCITNNLNWIKDNELTQVPIVFINGRVLPNLYELSDLSILLFSEDVLVILKNGIKCI
jgi:uncharacterized membrane protein